MNPTQELGAQIEETPAEPACSDPTVWYPHYVACLQHFLNHAQHSLPVQSMAAFVNIRLPCQWLSGPISQFEQSDNFPVTVVSVSLRPYIQRLIVTGNDTSSVLRDFFGNNWKAGVEGLWKQERLNYLFTAKSRGWAATRDAYNILPDEQIPVLQPLRNPMEEELRTADVRWSEWLAMEDWMVGPRSPW